MGQITRDDIISFDCTIKLTYKGCEVTAKRYGKYLEVHVCNFSNKGYYTEKVEDFIGNTQYVNLLNYLNENVNYIEGVYQKTVKENTRKNHDIKDLDYFENN